MTRIKKLLFFVLIATMTVALSLGIVACGEEKTVTYTVTVTCEDESVLSGVKALLEKDGKKSEDKALSGGKASFELEAGSYTVVLTGVPEEYTYEQKTVTESAPNVSVALAKKSNLPADGLAAYTVTVTCEDESVLAGVKVRLMLGTTVAEEKTLSDGKADFRLQPGDYLVTLVGVPAEYTYEQKTFTEPDSAVTIALTKISKAADVTVKVAAGKDMFGKDRPETLLQNAHVDFYRSETDIKPVASATTNESGVAHFDELAAGTYLVNVNGKEHRNVSVSGGAATVTLNEKLGSGVAPLVWTLGENEVPFTQEALESLGESNVYYTLVVQEDGVYSFDADNYNVNVTCDAIEGDLNYTDDHIAVTLTAGTVYTFACSSTGALAESGNFGYTVTVTKGNTQEGGTTPDPDTPDVPEKPTAPWKGSGTEAEPYEIETLVGEFKNVYVEYDGTAFTTVYFKYTPAADGSYTVTLTEPGNAIVTFVGASPAVGAVYPQLNAESGVLSVSLKIKKGTAFMIRITGNDEAKKTATFLCSFKVETYTEAAAKKGSVHNPDTLAELLGTHTVTTANTYYYLYHATAAGTYTVSTTYSQGIVFTVRTELNPDKFGAPTGKKLFSRKLSAGDLGKFELEADKDYYFAISSGSDGEASGAEETLNFTMENSMEGTATAIEQVGGTAATPAAVYSLSPAESKKSPL